MDLRLVLASLAIYVFCLAVVLGQEECNPRDLTSASVSCHDNKTCKQVKGQWRCQCEVGFQLAPGGKDCVPAPTPLPTPAATAPSPSPPPSHAEQVHHSSVSTGAVTAAVLIPLTLAAGGLLFVLARRYRWYERLQALRGRRYEEVRIGHEDDEDDDPPLA